MRLLALALTLLIQCSPVSSACVQLTGPTRIFIEPAQGTSFFAEANPGASPVKWLIIAQSKPQYVVIGLECWSFDGSGGGATQSYCHMTDYHPPRYLHIRRAAADLVVREVDPKLCGTSTASTQHSFTSSLGAASELDQIQTQDGAPRFQANE
jgi:hypothetical protein